MLPTLVALGVGLAALAWGLVLLQQLFAEETQDARARLAAQRADLERAAGEALAALLHQRWADAADAFVQAQQDPLAPDRDLSLVVNDVVERPRPARPRQEPATPLRQLYESLERASEDELRHAEGPDAAFAAGVVLATRHLLADDDAAGLQRRLLADIGQLTQGDFDFIARKLAALDVPTSPAFRAKWQELALGTPLLPRRVQEPALYRASWYLEPILNGTRGVAVPVNALLAQTAQALTAAGTLERDDRLRLTLREPLEPMSSLRVVVDRPAFRAQEADIARRYGLKNTMIAVCGLLALALTVVGVVGQHRKHRFLELKSDFVATVSHELRTPLASIRLLAETLERRPTDEAIRHFPARIVRVVDNLAFLVENILSFNRVTKGRWRLDEKPLRLDEVVDELRGDLTQVAQVPVVVTLEGAEPSAGWLADPALVRLLFVNLGRNACAYNHRDPVDIAIRTRPSPPHEFVIEFKDNGIGIPVSEWQNVFHDFYRLETSANEAHGSGLGLALCRRIMALHRGQITVDASGPQGTTFVITFSRSGRPS